MGAFSRAFSAARDGVNARRAEGRRPSNDARFDKKTENSIDKHRGYDVMAVPRDNYATGILANLVSLAWVDPTTGTYPVRQVNAKVSNGKQAVKWFEGAVKQGERYLLTVNLDGGGGHVVILTRNEDGVLMVYDPQSGDRFLGEKEILDSFMRRVEVKYSMQEGFSPAILRVDNAQVNVPFIRKIIRRRHDP